MKILFVFKLLFGIAITFAVTNTIADDLPGNELSERGGAGMFTNPGISYGTHSK